MNPPKITVTKEYEKFSTILGNRIINEKKVENLMADISKGLNLLPYCPVIVFRKDNNLKIVDGQHRFEATKRLELPVHYVECEQLDLKKIASLNSRSDKWKNSDFLECYVRLGIEDYVTLLDFLRKYKIIYSASIDLLMYGNPKAKGSNSMEAFRNGEFEVKFLDKATELVNLTTEIFGRYVFSNDRYLIGAVMELKEAGICDFEVLKNKVSEAPNIMEKKSNIKEYKYLIEQVYNFKNQKRVALF
ncbi:ParB/RepB/Spo0J family partition protein [Aequorivita echinoideorum]|uniref:ParB/RepB/Spo0J family partition protein n=1 Tax=Aequorivita echinoideorum TaxID=1549647 RepID=A0ABS5S370_9FLAO|nr:ParB/RepB/Spo0J family partition protein [Aequorivita echinoideorum]MBT0607614.1 ParB/RepB/Spo0J family partition protein [Aequorivita echinoideorum]